MIKKCQICNGEYDASGNNARYCPQCGKEQRRKREKEKTEQIRSQRTEKNERKEPPRVSIAEQDRKARAECMTYGKYTAKYGEVEE